MYFYFPSEGYMHTKMIKEQIFEIFMEVQLKKTWEINSIKSVKIIVYIVLYIKL